MTLSPLEQRIRKAYNRARTAWLVLLIAAFIGILVYLPVWWLFILIPVAFVTYYGTLLLLAIVIADSTTQEELAKAEARNKAYDEGEKEIPEDATPEEKKLAASPNHEIAVVEELGPVIGTYMDKPIHAFVLVKAPNDKELSKFEYHGPARVTNGIPEIPTFDDMLFACIGGILYSKNIQPA